MGELQGEQEAHDEPLERAVEHVIEVAGELMDRDPSIRSVGVGLGQQGYEYVALRVRPAPLLKARIASPFRRLPRELAGTPVRVERHAFGPQLIATVVTPGAALIPEQSRQRPLVSGLRIQNIDDDVRTGKTALGRMTVGSLGCFVRLPDDSVGLLSNNHVIAGTNNGLRLVDRVLQPNGVALSAGSQVATLTDFVPLTSSAIGANVKSGTAILNVVDAAVAQLDPALGWSQDYLPIRRPLGPLTGIGVPVLGDAVYMVGSQGGPRFGKVANIATVAGPIPYAIGNCWFRRSILISGPPGQPFAVGGDSGAVVVRVSDNRVLGLLYAANPTRSWACPIDDVLRLLNCTFA